VEQLRPNGLSTAVVVSGRSGDLRVEATPAATADSFTPKRHSQRRQRHVLQPRVALDEGAQSQLLLVRQVVVVLAKGTQHRIRRTVA
jgi:hypothetical protein